MSRLKIIEANYFDPNNISGGFNVSKELIQMVDADRGVLYYEGLYNDIFGDPAKRVNKKLKIILEYDGQRHTKVYGENNPINLPSDLNLTTKKTSSWSWLYDKLIIEPNFFGLGIRGKDFIEEIRKRPPFKRNALAILTIVLVLAVSSFWWLPKAWAFLEEVQKRFIDYNDPSRVLDNSIFDVIQEMEKLSTDKEKQLFIQNYSGLRTRIEYGQLAHATTSEEVSVLADIDVNSKILTCDFDKKWRQRLSILEENVFLSFIGVIDRYDIDTGKLSLFYCNLLDR